MQIVAFMQNAWFPESSNPRHFEEYHTNQAFHQRLLAGTMSGRRLFEAFGDPLFRQIWWDNATDEIAIGDASIRHPYKVDYIEGVIKKQSPHLILAFGNEASTGVAATTLSLPIKVMECHHPNARHKTQEDLNAFAKSVREYILLHDKILCDTPEWVDPATRAFKQISLL